MICAGPNRIKLILLLCCFGAFVKDCSGVRLCVPGEEKKKSCNELQKDLRSSSVRISCIHARDRYECQEFLIKDYVDVVLADAEDVYFAQARFASNLIVLGETVERERSGEAFRYESVAVVRKSTVKSISDLKGAKSCHTGYRKTAGWHIPISSLVHKKILPRPCDPALGLNVAEQDLKAVSSYFGRSCIPGQWAPDTQTNTRLKSKYAKLCSLCSDPSTCDDEDRRSGYEGALRCLVDAQADVAWTKLSVVQQFMNKHPNVTEQFGFLCRDGVVQTLEQPCHWGARPWRSWLVSSKSSHKDAVVKALKTAMDIGSAIIQRDYMQPLFGSKKSSTFIELSNKPSVKEYMQTHVDYMETITSEICPVTPVKLCVNSQAAKRKCDAMTLAFESRRIRPRLHCVMTHDNHTCLELVKDDTADVMSAGPTDLFNGKRYHGLTPILSEQYGLLSVSYYAVAVVKANSTIKSLADLKGKRSCHTGVGRTAGWKVPISVLMSEGLISANNCNYAQALASFFSVSCIPGIKDSANDPMGLNPESLCGLCPRQEVSVHNGGPDATYTLSGAKDINRCSLTKDEPYYGYSGAFRCLAQGGGDVAFIKHTTVGDNTNGNSNEDWSKNLKARDFKLLCRDGRLAEASDFERCYWSKVPSRKMMVRSDLPESRKEDIRILFTTAADQFPSGQDVFALFGSFQNHNNVIFKDSTTNFELVPSVSLLGTPEQDFFRSLKLLESCSYGSPSSTSLIYPIPGLLLALLFQLLVISRII